MDALVVRKVYYLKAFVYDERKNSIHVESEIEWGIPSKYFRVVEKRNHELLVEPLELSSSQAIHVSFKKQVEGVKTVSIVAQIRLVKPSAVLLLPNVAGQQLQLVAEGGSGSYEWEVSEEEVVSVSGSGVCHVVSQGSAVVTVRDFRNAMNHDWVRVNVTTVAGIQPVEYKKELITNRDDVAYVRAISAGGQYFTNCSSLSFSAKNSHYFITQPDGHSYQAMLQSVEQLRRTNDQLAELLPRSTHPLYSTSGVCRGVLFKASKRGDTST